MIGRTFINIFKPSFGRQKHLMKHSATQKNIVKMINLYTSPQSFSYSLAKQTWGIYRILIGWLI